MRHRITLAIVGMVVAALALAGAGTLLLDQVGAQRQTKDELRHQADALVAIFDETNVFRALVIPGATAPNSPTTTLNQRTELARIVARIKGLTNLKEEDIGLLVGASLDRLDGSTPRNIQLTATELDALKTNGGAAIAGNRGRVVFAAAASTNRVLKYVIIVARAPTSQARAAFGWFLVASGAVIGVGILVAVWLSRSLTSRLRAAQATTHAIAAGDLAARVPEPAGGENDEVADLSRSINAMAEQLERSRGLERQFLMSITHDLRTPLTSIQGYAEALSDEAIEPEKAAETIRAQAQRLNRLVTDLLDLAKLESRSFSFETGKGDVVDIVGATVHGFVPKAAERNVNLVMVPSAPQFALTDPMRLGQIVSNLVENAMKFARTTIEVSVTLHQGWVTISVADDGVGIAPDDLPHVFERLYVARAQPARKESGSGLGLAIVRELVTAMGGHVAARSPVTWSSGVTGGTQMLVYLPPA